jgi:hypothetical protein
MMVKPREDWNFRDSGKVVTGRRHGLLDRTVKVICFKNEANRNVGVRAAPKRRHHPAEVTGTGLFWVSFAHRLI